MSPLAPPPPRPARSPRCRRPRSSRLNGDRPAAIDVVGRVRRAAPAARRRDGAAPAGRSRSQPVRHCTRRWIVGMPTDVEVAQADLDRRAARGSRSCRPRSRPRRRRRVWRWPATEATPIVPPANHGRSQPGRAPRGGRRAQPIAGRVAEHLVPGDRDEVGLPARQVEPVGRHEGRGVQQHVPAALVRAASIQSSGCRTPE